MQYREKAPRIEIEPRFKILFLVPTSASKWHGPDHLLVSREMGFEGKGLERFRHMILSRIKVGSQVVEGRGSKIPSLSLPESPGNYAAVIITGSAWSVRGEAFPKRGQWIRETKEFLKQVVRDEIPILGVCFGAQVLARALGGDIERKQQEVGCVRVSRRPGSTDDPLFRGLPSEFYVQANHEDYITRLPPDGVLLAESERGIQAFRVGKSAWGVLFHPERKPDITRSYIEESRKKLIGKGLDPDQLIANIRPTPDAAMILTNFLNFVLSQAI